MSGPGTVNKTSNGTQNITKLASGSSAAASAVPANATMAASSTPAAPKGINRGRDEAQLGRQGTSEDNVHPSEPPPGYTAATEFGSVPLQGSQGNVSSVTHGTPLGNGQEPQGQGGYYGPGQQRPQYQQHHYGAQGVHPNYPRYGPSQGYQQSAAYAPYANQGPYYAPQQGPYYQNYPQQGYYGQNRGMDDAAACCTAGIFFALCISLFDIFLFF